MVRPEKDSVKVRIVLPNAPIPVRRAAVGAVRAGVHALQPAGHSRAQLGSDGARRGEGGGAVAQEDQGGRLNSDRIPEKRLCSLSKVAHLFFPE